MQHTLSDKYSIGYNPGLEWDGESPYPIFLYTFSNDFSISDRISAFIEIYGFAPQKSKVDHRFDYGLSYLLRPNVLLDFSGGIGLSSNAPNYFFALGFSFRLKD